MAQVNAGVVQAPLGNSRKLAPQEIPMQVLVSMFFVQVAHRAAGPDERWYADLLRELGIPPGGDGDRALRQAARSALKVIEWPEWPVDPTALGAEKLHTAAILKKATALADIYGDLLVRLSLIDGAAERVAAHVEKKRHTIAATQVGEPGAAAVASEAAFTARLREVLDERLPERIEP
jgi:hypothetical protein